MANGKHMIVTKVGLLGKAKTRIEKEIKNLESDPEWDKTEYGKRKRKAIILEKKAIIEAIDCYTDKLAQEIKENN